MTPTLPAIKTTLQNGELDSAAQQLLTFAQASHPRFVSEMIGHLARLKQIAADERKGVVSADVTMMRKNQVLYALLDLVDVMEEAGKASAAGAESAGGNSVVIGGNVSNSVIILGDHNKVKQKRDDEDESAR